MQGPDPGAVAREIIDANLYMVLATADETGRPWASPVYFANAGYAELFWVSSPERVGLPRFDGQVGCVDYDALGRAGWWMVAS